MTQVPPSIPNYTAAKEQFWRSVEERAMKIPFCRACRAFFFYPRPVCPRCWSDAVEFRGVSGRGTIWSYTVIRFAHGNPSEWHSRLPYVNALIDLDEGARMMANVVDAQPEAMRCGLRVRLTYIELAGRTLPAFTLE